MGNVLPVDPVLKFCALFAQEVSAIQWACRKLESKWGSLALVSPVYDFTETQFYEREMGAGLKKQLVVLEGLEAPEWLPGAKRQSNQWEQEYLSDHDSAVPRPLNMDPGYLTLTKLVLATTKDRDHRLYLGQGIYGEVTVHYKYGQWQNDRWTYPDYQRADYHQFLTECREYLKAQLKQS